MKRQFTFICIGFLFLIMPLGLAWAEDGDNFVLEITGLDPGIDVIINGKQVGFTPFSQSLPRTEIKLELRHPDWEPYLVVLPIPVKNKVTISPELVHSRPFELKSLKDVRDRLVKDLADKRILKGSWDTVGNISLWTMAGGTAVAGLGAVGAAVVDPQYQAATNTTDATNYHNAIQGWNVTFNVGVCAVAAGLVAGVVTLIFTPDLDAVQQQIDSIDRQIKTLEIHQ